MKRKVTIIVAIYNSEKFLRKCIESIIGQTYKNLEIILVDDGSPDNSGRICDDYAKEDKRIKVIHRKNGGACAARNSGLMAATGEYVSIIDGDDWLESDYIEYLMKIVNDLHVDMAMTDKIFTTRDRIQIKNDIIEKITPEEAAMRIVYPIVPIGPWNKIYSLKLIRDNNISFNVPWSGEGLYFSFMAAQNSRAVGMGHRKIYNYRLNNAGSGLTNYKLEMGTNALTNAKSLQNKIKTKSKRLLNAVRWHIWKNYYFVLKLIIATKGKEQNKLLYRETKNELRKMMPSVAVKSEVPFRQKIVIVLKSLFPLCFVRRELKKEREGLKKDLMQLKEEE